MRITFSLAVFAATVFATPLAPAADLAQSAGALMQIDAHSLDSAGDPFGNGDPDHLLLGQAETYANPFETGTKQAELFYSVKILLDSVEKGKFRQTEEDFEQYVKELQGKIETFSKKFAIDDSVKDDVNFVLMEEKPIDVLVAFRDLLDELSAPLIDAVVFSHLSFIEKPFSDKKKVGDVKEKEIVSKLHHMINNKNAMDGVRAGIQEVKDFCAAMYELEEAKQTSLGISPALSCDRYYFSPSELEFEKWRKQKKEEKEERERMLAEAEKTTAPTKKPKKQKIYDEKNMSYREIRDALEEMTWWEQFKFQYLGGKLP